MNPALSSSLDRDLGFLELLRPVISEAHARLADGLGPEVAASLLDHLLDHLLERLRWMVERTLILELNISRLEGKLPGETPEARFASFIESLRSPDEAGAILARYPVLAAESARHAKQLIATSFEILERFAADRDGIVHHLFAGSDPGTVTALEPGRGDRHDGGRTVAILTFDSGRKLVYKPRSLAVDSWFQELLVWLNERGARPQLLPLRILDLGSHGWMEFAASASCSRREEVERFYERQGAWVALLYALEANDFHWENLIAAGEHPVLVDLETLFQPMPPDIAPGEDPLSLTVLRTGLLPRGVRMEGSGLIDVSGMGATAGQKTGGRFPVDQGTDRMRLAPAVLETPERDNLPRLAGVPVGLGNHRDAVVRGFQAMYRLLASHRGALLEGPLAACAGLEIRFLLRDTTVYSHLIHNSYHPDYLQNGLDRSRLFGRLRSEASETSGVRQVAGDEIEELGRGDIPRFGAQAGSTSLRTGTGRIVEGFFAESGLDRTRRRIETLGAEDLERQTAFVEASLGFAAVERSAWARETSREEEADPAGLLAGARTLGRRLALLAIREGERVSWLHPESQGLMPTDVDLYGGLSGIALFLAHLAARTGDGDAEELARSALATVRWRMGREPQTLIGAFAGLGGVLWTLTHLGLLWREPHLLDEAEQWAGLAPLVEEDRHFDLIGGAAGAIVALLALYRHRPAPGLLDLAVRCGEHLLAHARTDKRGMAWPPPPQGGDIPLTGLGHGAAGPAWALADLARATGEARFEAAARGALDYERSWYSPERRNWPDLREDRREADGTRAFVQAWCHGAPGIGFGRLALRRVLDDPETGHEIHAALASTRDEGFGGSHCLCHGDLGNLDLLLTAARELGDPELGATASRLAAGILKRLEARSSRCGGRAGEEIPGLMTGIAGIGYGLLRAADPERVPSVLLLDLPGPDLA
jgi:type 2 lantibiotic biosynthesis protein LanM